MGASADVDSAPRTVLLSFRCKDNRAVLGSHSVYLSSLLDKDVVDLPVVLGDECHAFLDGESGRSLYLKASGKIVCLSGPKLEV